MVVRKLQRPLQEIRTRMDCELPWVKLKVEGCRKSEDGEKQKKSKVKPLSAYSTA